MLRPFTTPATRRLPENPPTAAGTGCRVCERLDWPQRGAPPLGQPLRIDQDTSTFVPYPVTERTI